uniref:Uncharacterized protein n=1 Tax=Gadus morhua TaxID=8049 RepID=A0A8C4ZX15_GADMO
MAAVALVLVGLAVVLILSVGRHKGSYRTDEAKGGQSGQTADTALGGDRALPGAVETGMIFTYYINCITVVIVLKPLKIFYGDIEEQNEM